MDMSKEKTLTAKQQAFCRNVASGKYSITESYSLAFEVGESTKRSTVRTMASRLYGLTHIRAMCDSLIKRKGDQIVSSALSDRNRVLKLLREAIDGAEVTTNQLRASETLARACGMFTDKLEVTQSRGADDIASEIRARLAELAGSNLLPASDTSDGEQVH